MIILCIILVILFGKEIIEGIFGIFGLLFAAIGSIIAAICDLFK